MTTVLILEDCRESQKALDAIMKKYREDIRALFASTLQEAESLLRTEKEIHLFFLDINLDINQKHDQSGLIFAKKVRELSKYAFTPIVFITSASDMELVSYRETQCYRYLTKPYREQSVLDILEKVLKSVPPKETKQIIVKKDGINYRVRMDEILLVEAIPRGVRIHLNGESLDLKYSSIKQMMEKLPKEQFVQCHRMYVVNTEWIDYVDTVNQYIRMKGIEQPIEIGVTYKAEMRRWIHG